jgi:hypothetical protein
VAARVCGGRGPYANSIVDKKRWEAVAERRRGACPAETGAQKSGQGSTVSTVVVDEAVSVDLFRGEAERCKASAWARRFWVEEPGFMRLAGPWEERYTCCSSSPPVVPSGTTRSQRAPQTSMCV